MEENKNISIETWLKLDDYFNIASLLGKSIRSLAYQLNVRDSDQAADPVKPPVPTGNGVSFDEDGKPVFQADFYEADINNQINQLKDLFSPELRSVLGSSALYDMLALCAEKFDFDWGAFDDSNLNVLYRAKSAISWIITKRVFSIRHPEETIKIISMPDFPAAEIKPIKFSPFDDTDKNFISESCGSIHWDELFGFLNERPNSELRKVLSQISASGKIMIPSSKAFRKQQEIASSGIERELSVGHGAIIKASITGKDHKPLELSLFEMHIEAVIGQIFQENGFKEISISPAQIYRKYADLPSDATVSPEEIRVTIEAMDKLITTPATLDFTEQIEKHTRMKRREGFDYTNAKRVGTLITGVHDAIPVITHNGFRIDDSFTIHAMPMFYAYSYAIGQIYTVPSNLLTGEQPIDRTEKRIKTKGENAQRRRLSIDDISLRRTLIEYIEFQKGEREKRNRKLLRDKKPIPPYFEFDLPFETIAERVFRGNEAARKRVDSAKQRAKAKGQSKKPQSEKLPEHDGFTEKQLRTLREQTFDFMTMQVKLGNIKKCDYYKNGRSLRGVRIRL